MSAASSLCALMLSDSLLTFASYSDDLTKLSVLSLNFRSPCLAQKVCLLTHSIRGDSYASITVGTPKYIANKMKSKGLQRLRWYCQVCEKQCRDENGFKCHAQSEGHLRAMLSVGENAGRHIADFSAQFQAGFVQLLSRRHSTNRVKANNVYQEYIQDREHIHMNSTRWVTLTEFVKHLGRSGLARVDETEKGWFIAWIDNSPKALARQVRCILGA